MRKLTRVVALLIVALWSFATAHCSLEQLPGFEFLSCSDSSTSVPHQEKNCDQDGCSVVESGLYRADDQPTLIPEPILILAALLPIVELETRDEAPLAWTLLSVPSELAQVWQFSFRTALLPRAPSALA